MDLFVYVVGILTLLGTGIALYFFPRWLRQVDLIWLIITVGLLVASITFILSAFAPVTQINFEDRLIFLLFWGGVLIALNGTIVLKLPAGSLAAEMVDIDEE